MIVAVTLTLLCIRAAPAAADLVDPSSNTVWIFVRTDCPISNRYAPVIASLHARYASRGIQFKLIYAEPGVTAEAIARHRAEFSLPAIAIADARFAYVDRAGATITPEVAVFARGKLVYRGRIDDRHASLVRARPEPTRSDLEDVLDAVASGRTPAFRSAKAIGCVIERLPASGTKSP